MSSLTNQSPLLSSLTNRRAGTRRQCLHYQWHFRHLYTASLKSSFFVLLWQTSLDFSVLDLFLQVKYENIPLLWIMNAKLSNIWFLLVHFPLFNRTDKREQMRKNFCLFNQTVCLFAICGRYNYLLLQNFLHLIKTNPFIISSLRDKSVKSL